MKVHHAVKGKFLQRKLQSLLYIININVGDTFILYADHHRHEVRCSSSFLSIDLSTLRMVEGKQYERELLGTAINSPQFFFLLSDAENNCLALQGL